jgi:hypothetical protein
MTWSEEHGIRTEKEEIRAPFAKMLTYQEGGAVGWDTTLKTGGSGFDLYLISSPEIQSGCNIHEY